MQKVRLNQTKEDLKKKKKGEGREKEGKGVVVLGGEINGQRREEGSGTEVGESETDPEAMEGDERGLTVWEKLALINLTRRIL